MNKTSTSGGILLYKTVLLDLCKVVNQIVFPVRKYLKPVLYEAYNDITTPVLSSHGTCPPFGGSPRRIAPSHRARTHEYLPNLHHCGAASGNLTDNDTQIIGCSTAHYVTPLTPLREIINRNY